MDVISLYIYCILASSLYTLFNLYNNNWFTFNVSIMHILHLLSAHFKQSCSENTAAYKPVRFPVPFVITTVDCHVLFSLIMLSYLFISVDIYTVVVLLPCVMTINCLNLNLTKFHKHGAPLFKSYISTTIELRVPELQRSIINSLRPSDAYMHP